MLGRASAISPVPSGRTVCVKKAVILVVGLFVLWFLLSSPAQAADTVQSIYDITVDAFGQVGVFLSEFL